MWGGVKICTFHLFLNHCPFQQGWARSLHNGAEGKDRSRPYSQSSRRSEQGKCWLQVVVQEEGHLGADPMQTDIRTRAASLRWVKWPSEKPEAIWPWGSGRDSACLAGSEKTQPGPASISSCISHPGSCEGRGGRWGEWPRNRVGSCLEWTSVTS